MSGGVGVVNELQGGMNSPLCVCEAKRMSGYWWVGWNPSITNCSSAVVV